MLWIITDTHIGHKAIISYCGRPGNFGSLILKNWKRMIAPEDTILHLGDVAWGEDNLKLITYLPGHKILVRGNHDSKSLEYYMQKGFDFACDSVTMKLNGMEVLFSHHPTYWHRADINIHGHQHDLHVEDSSRLYLPLAIETMGYKPLAVDERFLRRVRSWVDRQHQPTLKEIMALGQDYYGEPREADVYGIAGQETFIDMTRRRKVASEILNSYGYKDWRRNKSICKAYDDFIKKEISKEKFMAILKE